MTDSAPASQRSFWTAFGPGLLFAGAAVGVSHLVQSTRAGAVYGLSLILVVIAANILKYPAFRFGPLYAAATGRSMLEGYRRQGKWALVLYSLLTLGTMFTVQAAVTVVTAGLAKAILGIDSSPIVLSGVLLVICGGLLGIGDYAWLDRIIKVVVAILTVSTLIAAALVVPTIDWSAVQWLPNSTAFSGKQLLFVAALVGWMPSAIDISVWHSLWTLARRREAGTASVKDTLMDFDIGYIGTALLAGCFLLLGAGVMHGKGVPIANGAAGFANQIINLYAQTLGEWARPVIGICAFAVMFSTTLTVVDGFPRALSVLFARFRGPEDPDRPEERSNRVAYWISLVVLAVGSLVVLMVFLKSLKAMVDLATTLSFLTAPILAWLNHRAVFSADMPAEHRPGTPLRLGSWAGIASLGIFALAYLWLRFAS
ncbi:MAG: divalent metal cation transporter [Myxococcales bacterium]|nr:divalent metal cation transporter [Myxococcales bacterium]